MPSLIQSVGRIGPITAAATFSLAFPSANGGGDLLIATAMNYQSAQSLSSITDTQGNTPWVRLPVVVSSGGNSFGLNFGYCLNCKPGANTVSLNYSTTTNYCAPMLVEYSNVSALRTSGAGNKGGNTSSVTTDSITPNIGDLLIAVCHTGSSNSGTFVTWTAPFTEIVTSNSDPTGSGHVRGSSLAVAIATSNTAQTATATIGGGGPYDWMARLVAFAPSALPPNSLMTQGVGI